MTGCCWACAATTLALMYSNWALRSGWCEPSSVLRLNWREKPSFTNSARTVSALIGCPISVSATASFAMLFDTQIKGRMGSPKVTGSTRRLSAGTSPGSVSETARRPPPPLANPRADRVPPQPNRRLVDHLTDLRSFPPYRNPQYLSHSDAQQYRDSVIVRGILTTTCSPAFDGRTA